MSNVYYSFNEFLKKKFNNKIRKIPINAGFPCPNKDGTKSAAGCIFCDEYGSGPLKTYHLSIEEQIETYIQKNPGFNFIAYFQAHSNTYAPVTELREKYELVYKYPEIVGVHIGTRPDAIRDEVIPLLKEIGSRLYLAIELGLQSVHEKSLKFLNRNHSYQDFEESFHKLKDHGLHVIVHLILGIPGESREDIYFTVREMNRLRPSGIKLHLMHVLKNTPLYDLYQKEPFELMKRETYEDLVINVLEKLSPDIVIHRLTGERDREIFFAPEWTLDKASVIHSIRKRMELKGTVQGNKFKS